MTQSPRQLLSERQAATVDALLDACHETLRDIGLDALSLREVARRAGVTHTTAYTYFAGKEHLVAELNWRLFQQVPTPEPDPQASPGDRLVDALAPTSELFADEPALAEALLAVMTTRQPEVARTRDAIGADLARRIDIALGDDATAELGDIILLCFTGAMVQAGMGYLTFDRVIDRIRMATDLWMAGLATAEPTDGEDTP